MMKIKPPTDRELRFHKTWPQRSEKKYLYWIKYGSLAWGLPTGVIISLIDYFSINGEFSINEALFQIPLFTVFGIFFGMLSYKGNAKRHQEIQEYLKSEESALT